MSFATPIRVARNKTTTTPSSISHLHSSPFSSVSVWTPHGVFAPSGTDENVLTAFHERCPKEIVDEVAGLSSSSLENLVNITLPQRLEQKKARIDEINDDFEEVQVNLMAIDVEHKELERTCREKMERISETFRLQKQEIIAYYNKQAPKIAQRHKEFKKEAEQLLEKDVELEAESTALVTKLHVSTCVLNGLPEDRPYASPSLSVEEIRNNVALPTEAHIESLSVQESMSKLRHLGRLGLAEHPEFRALFEDPDWPHGRVPEIRTGRTRRSGEDRKDLKLEDLYRRLKDYLCFTRDRKRAESDRAEEADPEEVRILAMLEQHRATKRSRRT